MKDGLFIEQFELLERWDTPMAVQNNFGEEELEFYDMYATIKAYEDVYGKGRKYQIKPLLDVLKCARDHKAGIILYGVLDFPIEFSDEDILRLEPEMSAIIALVERVKEEIGTDELIEKIGNVPIIFLGQYPDIEKGGTFGVHTVKHVKESYEMIPVFLNVSNASEYNKANHPITKTTINELRRFYNQFGILVEPHKQYWVEITPENI